MDEANRTLRVALVTCSYAPDLERCRQLCRSADQYVSSEMEHVLIVPRRDQALFDPLANARRSVVTVESLLPGWVKRVPWSNKWWLTPFTFPVRGWILQQVTKLSVLDATSAQVYVFADSDVSFVRPFGPAQVVRDGKVRLYRVPGAGQKATHLKWHRKATELLGLEPRDYTGSDYIGQLVAWRREDLLALHRRLEQTSGRDWRRLLCGTLNFSEYILYGIFVEHVLEKAGGHYLTEEDLCHSSWHYRIDSEADLQTFVQDIQPHQVAILVQSNLRLDWEQTHQAIASLATPTEPVA